MDDVPHEAKLAAGVAFICSVNVIFLFVYLKKFGVRLQRLLAQRFLLSTPCTMPR